MLAEYDIKIVHRSDDSNRDADALSRLVAKDLSSNDFTGARLDGPPRSDSSTEAGEVAATVGRCSRPKVTFVGLHPGSMGGSQR